MSSSILEEVILDLLHGKLAVFRNIKTALFCLHVSCHKISTATAGTVLRATCELMWKYAEIKHAGFLYSTDWTSLLRASTSQL